jgi:hypothetical protein
VYSGGSNNDIESSSLRIVAEILMLSPKSDWHADGQNSSIRGECMVLLTPAIKLLNNVARKFIYPRN